MELIINGTTRELEAETLADVVELLGLTGKPVVAEADGLVVTSEAWASTAVRPGMSIELVHFVGGG
ncbi:thiamine biosynthesis protein ThiS [Paenibacillus yonginensis]|uniref:Thiamine biosynthesis protein ThiS n=1 Tax=Paenibacillus yonginensis TaxID=1462996 RepID=A0A1B1MYM4_9BACL|nr:sulfur carrier protein ThiS [Paenibacillus yonginensis]ANS74249.1 thiamine biosynthesis protein ThiS [Paenibacillus yonginensis]